MRVILWTIAGGLLFLIFHTGLSAEGFFLDLYTETRKHVQVGIAQKTPVLLVTYPSLRKGEGENLIPRLATNLKPFFSKGIFLLAVSRSLPSKKKFPPSFFRKRRPFLFARASPEVFLALRVLSRFHKKGPIKFGVFLYQKDGSLVFHRKEEELKGPWLEELKDVLKKLYETS